ncbi:HAAS signaling domain-containing protein [Deinococcus radiotolerans]|uniref:Uncharacterized protein n=1 Tax=Deinococcus radiotolerans TaxID=1309407 RepID=A0ABQ2FKL5_9DEIO|nr:hypothetical protein [Deinococcus radiotolerans]GGL03513.1 hypothetical protein GCM10010844_22700 [Deinococcus radiotolerans]
MTAALTGWLAEALRDLTPATRDRVGAEYCAHVHDALDSGLTEAQAVASLGDPAHVNRALRRTYATQDLAEQYQRPPRRLWGTLLAVQVGYAGLMIWNNLEDRGDLIRHLPGPLTGLALMLGLTALTWRRPDPYRWTLGARLLMLGLMLSQWVTALLTPDRDLLTLVSLCLLPVVSAGVIWDAHLTARRVSRTLNLEAQA